MQTNLFIKRRARETRRRVLGRHARVTRGRFGQVTPILHDIVVHEASITERSQAARERAGTAYLELEMRRLALDRHSSPWQVRGCSRLKWLHAAGEHNITVRPVRIAAQANRCSNICGIQTCVLFILLPPQLSHYSQQRQRLRGYHPHSFNSVCPTNAAATHPSLINGLWRKNWISPPPSVSR